ncbi:MAG: DUF3098 domain-containing protein [Opitutaceae bacterium]|nr:DUF3098 domain-containing protein [Cytophagales bacterium]
MEENKLVFGKKNYTLLIIGIAVLMFGFIVMSLDREQYGFGFLGITLGPIIVCIGFIIPFFAIFTKSKQA